ncbi:DUF1697 domain-containing protein [Sphingobacterium endophyticum]|uniref:DUF1697 domain-containing protein n=1 Tax=Sphingobacterium endophyticum TaxID=2546448 RepID=UPI0012E0F98A|nr:DUF1697 domain-containing protein [Sphingobacterium endophyticum]
MFKPIYKVANVLLSSEKKANEVSSQIKSLLLEKFSLNIEVFVLNEIQIIEALENNPFKSNLPGNKVFITFLSDKVHQSNLNEFNKLKLSPEEYKIVNNIFYFYLPEGMAKSKLNNNFIENKLKINATGRNINTLNKLLNLKNK